MTRSPRSAFRASSSSSRSCPTRWRRRRRSAREPHARLTVGHVRHVAGDARPRAHAHPHGRRSEPSLHLRSVRHRHVQPVRPRRRAVGRRDAGAVVQPALHLRSCGARQDPPAPRHRQLREAELCPLPGPIRLDRGLPERVRRRDPHEHRRRVQAPVPRDRRADDRRHPVHGGQGRPPGRVLPHVQLAARCEQADRHLVRSPARRDPDARRPAAQPVQVGSHHRHPAARPRDPSRDPSQEGREGDDDGARRRDGVHRDLHHRQHP